jgi:hypothetical protein
MIDYGEQEKNKKIRNVWARMEPMNAFSQVNKQDNPTAPSHYKHGDTYEVIKVLEAWGLDECFYLGNVVKYVARAGKKDPEKEIEDLEKAKVYLEMKIKKLKS